MADSEVPAVLVVDDDEASRAILRAALEQAPLAVSEAASGREALSAVATTRPNLVILDVVMPGLDGFATCAALRRMPGCADLPILMLTGHRDEEAVARSFDAGATDFATKPIDQLLIAHRVRYLLKAVEDRAALRAAEERYRSLVEEIDDVIFSLDGEGVFSYISPACRRVLGYDPDEITGARFDALVHPEDLRDLAASFARTVAGEREPWEFRALHKDGRVVHLRTLGAPISGPRGVAGVRGVATDITARKAAERALADSETRYRMLFETARDGILILDPASEVILNVNPVLCELLGTSRSELLGRTPWELDVLEDVEQGRALLAGLQRDGHLRYAGLSLRARDGRTITVEVVGSVYLTGGKQVVQCNIRDISERHLAEELMQVRLRLHQYAETHTLSELLQKTLDEIGALTDSPIGFYHYVEPDQRTLSLQAWSTETVERFCAAEGAGMHYSLDQAGVWTDCVHLRRPVIHNDYASLPHRKGMPEGHAEVVRELVVPVFRGERIVAILGIGNKPTDYVENDIQLVSYLADVAWAIAESRRAGEALRDSEQRYRLLVESLGEGMGIVDREERFLFSNAAAAQLFGVSDATLEGHSLSEFLAPDQMDLVAQQTRIRRAARRSSYELNIDRPDGTQRTILVTAAPLTSAAGDFIGTLGVFRDISERKRAEDALRQAEQQRRALLDSIPDLAWLKDRDGRFIAVNAQFGRACGLPPGELEGMTDLDVWPPELARRYREDDRRVVESGQAARVEEPLADHATSDLRWIETIKVPILGVSGEVRGTAGIARDITARRQAQEAERSRTAQLEALREVSLAVATQLELDALLQTICEQALKLFAEADASELFLLRPELGLLERFVAVGEIASSARGTVRRGHGFAGRIWKTGQPGIVHRRSRSSSTTRPGRAASWRSALGAPILWRDEFLGVLGVLARTERAFTALNLELVELFATQAAAAIVNARLFDQVEHLAMVDELTLLYNRRGLLEVGGREVERARRFRHPLAVLFIDIDRFKVLNDRHGHEVGDRALESVSLILRGSLRQVDIAARFGGEEIVALLVETDIAGAREVAERVRERIEATSVITDAGSVRVTVSIGVAAMDPSGMDLDALVRCADEAMYAAKRAGRNRVVVFEPSSSVSA